MVIYLYHTFICQYLCISIKSWPDPKVQHVQSKMGCKPSLNLSMVSHTQYTTAMLIWGPFSPLPFGWVCFQSYSCSLLPAHQYQVMNIKCTLTMYLSAKICSGVLVLRKTPESLHSGLTILCPLQPQKWGCRHCSPQPWHSALPLENLCNCNSLSPASVHPDSNPKLLCSPIGPRGVSTLWQNLTATHYCFLSPSEPAGAIISIRSLESGVGAWYIRKELSKMGTNKTWGKKKHLKLSLLNPKEQEYTCK